MQLKHTSTPVKTTAESTAALEEKSNSFEPWEAVAVEFRAGNRIGRRLLALVSVALFEGSYGLFEWTKCKWPLCP